MQTPKFKAYHKKRQELLFGTASFNPLSKMNLTQIKVVDSKYKLSL